MDEDLTALLMSYNQFINNYIGNQLRGLGTPGEMLGSPPGSLKFSLEHSLEIHYLHTHMPMVMDNGVNAYMYLSVGISHIDCFIDRMHKWWPKKTILLFIY